MKKNYQSVEGIAVPERHFSRCQLYNFYLKNEAREGYRILCSFDVSFGDFQIFGCTLRVRNEEPETPYLQMTGRAERITLRKNCFTQKIIMKAASERLSDELAKAPESEEENS